jgi:hypothetical protein
MTESVATAAPDAPDPGLFARLIGVLFSPGQTFAAVAAHPRALGALLVTGVLIVAAQTAFMSSETGRTIVLEQQVSTMESFGMTVTDEMYTQMDAQMARSLYINPVITLIVIPIANAIVAGLLMVVFTMLLGGAGTFKQVNAIVAHAGIVIVIQQAFATPLSLATERMASATLGAFVPMLEETSFVALFLGAIDLFYVWWMVVLAIGLAVLYRRRTGPIAMGLLSFYVIIALLLALVRS